MFAIDESSKEVLGAVAPPLCKGWVAMGSNDVLWSAAVLGGWTMTSASGSALSEEVSSATGSLVGEVILDLYSVANGEGGCTE